MEKQSWHLALAYLLVALAVATVVMLCASCGGRAPKSEKALTAAPPAPPADSLTLSVSLNAGSYAVGERVRIKMVARNTTQRPLRLTFPTAQRYDFVVKKEGRVAWQWSADMMFAQVIGIEALTSGDSLAFTDEWDQKMSDGTNAVLGAYTIQGVLKTRPEKATREKRFGIVD